MAELIAKGVSSAAVLGGRLDGRGGGRPRSAIEVARIVTKGRFPLSAVSIGLGVVLPPEASFAMWVGAMMFWVMGRAQASPARAATQFWVEGMEPICAGLISGAALVGIGNAIVNVLM